MTDKLFRLQFRVNVWELTVFEELSSYFLVLLVSHNYYDRQTRDLRLKLALKLNRPYLVLCVCVYGLCPDL